ncbi:MAG: LuxR C-terminal-related transcriptional regulator [Actinomycetota bacterium]
MRVALADDAVLFREGIARVLSERGFEVVAQVGNAEELLGAVETAQPDVVVVDIRMPPTHTHEGLLAALQIRESHPEIGVLMLSQYIETHYAMQLLADRPEGAGYLLKDRVSHLSEFTEAVTRVASKGSVIDPAVVAELLGRRRMSSPVEQLTERERDILALMAEGRSNQAIGERVFLSAKTVEAHVSSIFSKLGLPPKHDDNRRVLAVLTFLEAGE